MIEESKIEAQNPPLHKADVMRSAVFNEDCMLVMKRYPDKFFNLAIVDPPYGIGMDGDFSCFSKNDKGFLGTRNHKQKQWDNERPTAEYFAELRRVSKNQIIFWANYFTEFLPASMGWIVWDKKREYDLFSKERGVLSYKPICNRFETWKNFKSLVFNLVVSN